jgi:single stranded DNA-binding protein
MHATISRTVLTVDGIRAPLLEARPAGAPADEAVVFVHGNPGSSQDWVPLLERAGQLSRAVAWDHPGFGQADKPAGFDYTVGGYAAHLGRCLDTLGIATAHLVGHNLTDNPEVRYTEGGIARAMFRVAVSGRREQEASFFTVVVWRDQAEHAAESLSKGSRVVVVGRLQQRSWTAEDGSARSVVEVVGRGAGAEPALGDADDDQDNEEPGPVATCPGSSQRGCQSGSNSMANRDLVRLVCWVPSARIRKMSEVRDGPPGMGAPSRSLVNAMNRPSGE